MSSKEATITIDNNTIKLPVVEGTENELGIDISTLRSKTKCITFDKGYKNTGSTTSKITFLDGEDGILRYRGYPIEQLAEKSNFLEVAYLLINGELPSDENFKKFDLNIKNKQILEQKNSDVLNILPKEAHPMGLLSSLVIAQTAINPNVLKSNFSTEKMNENVIDIMAKLPIFAGKIFRKGKGKLDTISAPIKDLTYIENMYMMMFADSVDSFEPDSVIINALDKLLILHADHEQNCSTSTVRLVGSSKTCLHASISAGINALWGKLHGGANQAVIEMLEMIKNDGGNINKYINRAKDKQDSFRLMGFGHRVYKNFDPRAKIIKKAADEVLKDLEMKNPILDIAKELENIAINDDYFIEKKLYPNVDFYSGIIYKVLGIPSNMFTVMFALGRLPGWIAQWKEMLENDDPIGRPRQIYTGHTIRNYTK